MSLFGPIVIGGQSSGSGGGQSSGSGSGSGGTASGLSALALRVSQDGTSLEFRRADGTWATTGLALDAAQDAAGNTVARTIAP